MTFCKGAGELVFCGGKVGVDVKSLVNTPDGTEDRNGGKLLLTISVGFELLERLLENEVGNSELENSCTGWYDNGPLVVIGTKFGLLEELILLDRLPLYVSVSAAIWLLLPEFGRESLEE
jgi:hypothetical protein